MWYFYFLALSTALYRMLLSFKYRKSQKKSIFLCSIWLSYIPSIHDAEPLQQIAAFAAALQWELVDPLAVYIFFRLSRYIVMSWLLLHLPVHVRLHLSCTGWRFCRWPEPVGSWVRHPPCSLLGQLAPAEGQPGHQPHWLEEWLGQYYPFSKLFSPHIFSLIPTLLKGINHYCVQYLRCGHVALCKSNVFGSMLWATSSSSKPG